MDRRKERQQGVVMGLTLAILYLGSSISKSEDEEEKEDRELATSGNQTFNIISTCRRVPR